MAEIKITQLTEDTSCALTDLLLSIESPSGVATAKKVTIQTLQDAITTYKGGSSLDPISDIYDIIYPSISCIDSLIGLREVEADSTTIAENAVAGYLRSSSPYNSGAGTQSCALFGAAFCNANDVRVWGINTLLQDSATRVAGAGTTRVIANEFDLNVYHTGTTALGLQIYGNFEVNPTLSYGVQIETLTGTYPFSNAFVTADASASIGLALGMVSESGNNVASQPIYNKYTDGSGDPYYYVMQVVNGGAFRLSTTGAVCQLNVYNGDIALQTSHGVWIDSLQVLGDRVIDADLGNSADSGDSDTDDLIEALRDVILSHGLGAAS